MKGLSRRFSLFMTFSLVILAFLFIFVNTASANADIDAEVTNITTTEASPIPSTRKAPVSIANYSDIITESADTYDYSKVHSSEIQSQTTELPEATTVPSSDTPASDTTTDSSSDSTTTTTDSNETTDNSNSSTTSINNYVFIGDSRTVHMQLAVGEQNHSWSCKSAMGLKWMKSTGVPAVENKITNGTAVIILMGVNDLYNSKNYIEYINQKASEWASKGAQTYFVSVNQINESTYSGFKNSAIEEFNAKLKAGLINVKYIDTYNYLKYNTIDFTKDGLHYNNKTSRDIYNYIMTTFMSTTSF